MRLEAYVVWSHDPGLRSAAAHRGSGPASRLTCWWKRWSRDPPTYLASEIEAAAWAFRAMVAAERSLVSDHTPIELLGAREASGLINRLGTMWDGATGSGMNWRLALSELGAHANLLRDLYCLDAVLPSRSSGGSGRWKRRVAGSVARSATTSRAAT